MKDKLLENLLTLKTEDFASYLLREDLLYSQIKNREEIIKKSINTGFNIAEDLKSKKYFNFCDLILKYKFKISEENTKNEFNFYELAAFEEPNKIILFKDNIEKLEEEIKLENSLKELEAKNIILAHELYHKLEEEYKLYTDEVYITYKKLKFINKKRKLLSPSEIGAMAFSKNILNLKINPLIINYLLARSYNKKEIIYKKMTRGQYESNL